jgi:hypothetical protein
MRTSQSRKGARIIGATASLPRRAASARTSNTSPPRGRLSVQPRIVRVRDNDGKPKRFAIARTRVSARRDDLRLSKEDRNGREKWNYDQWDSKS